MTSFALLVKDVDLCQHATADVAISIGRRNIWEQSLAGTLTATLVSSSHSPAALKVGDPLVMRAADVQSGWALFSGWITDLQTQYLDTGEWETRIIAAGPLSPLARTPLVSALPKQTDSERIARILTDAGWSADLIPIGVTGPQLTAHDADPDSNAAELLRAAARSGHGYLYEDHSSGSIGYQPMEWRTVDVIAATWDLQTVAWDDAGTVTWDDMAPPVPPIQQIPCAAAYRDALIWASRSGDVANYVEVLYGTSGQQYATAGEPAAAPLYGYRVDTQLAAAADAQALADRILITRAAGRWMIDQATLDVAYLSSSQLQSLPDWLFPGGRVRLGPFPVGAPHAQIEGFIEGWTHTISQATEGISWLISCTISPWDLTAPATRWDDAAGSWDQYPERWNTLLLADR